LLSLAKTPYEDGVIRSTATAHPGASDHGRLATPAATILGSSLAFVDGAAVNVALPALERLDRRHGRGRSGSSTPIS
jgi:hypothetical protein